MTQGGKKTETDWLTPLQAALANLPEDYAAAYETIGQMRHAMLKELAAALEARINTYVQSLPQTTYAEKQEIAKKVNHDLRSLSLCLRCPATGGPAILAADFRDNEELNSRFR